MGCIYKITNNINNKAYIGYTTQSFEHRMKQHKNDDIQHDTLLGRAIAKYGWDNFSCEIIECCDDKENLLELEKYYIKKFNSYKPNGYNMTLGGEKMFGENNPFFGKKHTQQTKLLLSEKASLRTKELNPFFGKHHKKETIQKLKKIHCKPICAIDEHDKIVKIFDSGVMARNWLLENKLTKDKTANSAICRAIKHGKKAFGYYWRYFNEGVETMDDECNPVG